MKFGQATPVPPAIVFSEHEYQDATKTVVVVGVPRGGTSAMAALVDAIGVPIMREPRKPNFEHDGLVFKSFDQLPPLFRSFDEQFSVWGFKNPHMRHFSTTWFHKRLRNPYYILVTKDVVSMAIRSHSDETSTSVREQLSYQAQQSGQILSWFSDLPPAPKLLVSYSKMLVHPRETARIVADFCKTTPTQEMLDLAGSRISSTGGYLIEEE